MPLAEVWFKAWVYLGLVCGWAGGARPRFDTSTDMGLVLIPADAEIDSVIFRLRAIDQDADYPLVFEVTATITPVVRIDNLPCTPYNKICQANVILTKRLVPGRFHDFAVRVRDTKGDSNSMQATISATNTTTSRDKIFPRIPSLIMVPEDTKPGKELDYFLVRGNSWSSKPVYVELWQPNELFTIQQQQMHTQTRVGITLNGELDFEMQSMYTLTIYATDPYTERGKDTRNIAGLNIVVIVQDVQDVPPIFTLAPPLTRLNNSLQTGDIVLRVHAEDGDKGVPREITYGLVSEGNPFVPFFNISEMTGEIVLVKPLEELTQITHVGAPVVLSVVAEEIRKSRNEPPAQATVVEVGFLLGEPGNSPPYFENDNYVASIPENMELGSAITFPEQYSTRVRDEDIGKAGVFALKLQNNNGTFEINPTVAERTADFMITVRDNTLIDYETYKSLFFKIIAQEIGPATNLSASATVIIYIQDVNDNLPVFDEESYQITLSENVTAGTRVTQVHATDKDAGLFGSIKYTEITGEGSDAFAIDSDTGLIIVAMGSSLDREMAAQLQLSVNARDENGKGNMGVVPLIVNLLDVNDNAPIFEKDLYEFMLNSDLTNFTAPAIIKATDADAEPPNNEVRYELIHGNYENKFYLNEITGELTLRSPITKFRRKKQSVYENLTKKLYKGYLQSGHAIRATTKRTTTFVNVTNLTSNQTNLKAYVDEIITHRRKRAANDVLYTLTVRAYDLGVPHLASETQVSIIRGTAMEARVMMFVVPGERPNLTKTAETLATITGGRVTVLDTRPYVPDNRPGIANGTVPAEGKRTIVIARVEQTEPGAPLVDVEKIRNTLAANGVGIIGGMGATNVSMTYGYETTTKLPIDEIIHEGGGNSAGTYVNKTISNVHEEVTVYKAENKLLFWLLIVLGLLMLLAIMALIICCICPGCPFYMAPRKRRVYSSETLIARSDGRPKRHLHRKPMAVVVTSNGKKQAWSADPTRRNWQFNRRNTKNGGLASLPGDVVYISERPPIDQANVESLRLRDGPAYDPSRRRKMEEQERMYVEDVEDRKIRDYDGMDADSLQRHEIERGSDILRQSYRRRYADHESNNEQPTMREQHFYREGNAEVLQLVTRGQVEDDGSSHQRHYPTTLIVDGKDVLLQRFMQDQKTRHELQEPMPETMRTVESHQHQKNLYQQEILLLPEDLELRHRRADELRSSAQKLAMDDRYEAQKVDAETQIRDARHVEVSMSLPGIDRPSVPKDQTQSTMVQSYAFHDLELARQNALLTRLLFERESRHAGATMADATSYLETQSLPGQVAIATQTDRAAATQTERHARSRSDNDESDEDTRNRKKSKTRKRHTEYDSKRTRILWMKSPIEEEGSPCFDKRLNILQKKGKEVKEARKISLEPGVLREISDSLDENGGSCRERESTKTYEKAAEESNVGYKVLGDEKNGSTSSTEVSKQQCERTSETKKATENSSSPEISLDNGKYVRETTEKRSTRKESKTKKQKKVESVIKPSFRVLEREITMLTKKLSRLADKKQTTTADKSQRKPRTSKDSKKGVKDIKDPDHVTSGKTETSKVRRRPETPPSTSKDKAVIAKTREKFKYQQPITQQVMSPDSSEYEDAFEKSNKSKPALRQEVAKHKQPSTRSHIKKKQIERKEHKQQITQRTDREVKRHRDTVDKENGRSESKTDRIVKSLSRTQKLAAIGRRVPVAEEPSTNTSSDPTNGKKDSFADRDSDKNKSVMSSEIASDQREWKENADRTSEGFSDDFVAEIQREDIEQQNAFRSLTNERVSVDANAPKRNTEGDARQEKVVQQFTDDFEIEQIREHQISIATEDASKIVHDISHDFDEEHASLKKDAKDFAFPSNLGYVQLKDESMSDTAKEQQTEPFEIFRTAEQLHDGNQKTISSHSVALGVPEEHQTEGPSSYDGRNDVEEEIIRTSGEKETKKSPREIEKGTLGIEEIMLQKYVHELKVPEDAEGTVEKKEEADALKKHAESLEVSSITAEQKWYKENGLCSDVDVSSPPEIEDLKNIKDIAGLLHSDGEDYAVELHKIEDDVKEKLSHDAKEYNEEEAPLEESTIDAKIMMEELAQTENGSDLLRKIKSDVEKESKLTVTDSDGRVTEKPKDIPKEYLIQDLRKINEDTPSTLETLEIISDVSPSFQGDSSNLVDIHRASLIDKNDKMSIDIDTVTQEISKDSLIQSELSAAGEKDIARQETDMDKFERLSRVPVTKIESHEAKEESSHVSLPEVLGLRETKLSGVDEPLTEVLAAQEKITDSEQLEVEHVKEEEKPYREEDRKEKEQSLEIKGKTDEEIKEARDKEPTDDQSPKETEIEKLIAGKPDTTDESGIIAESTDVADSQIRQNQEEERTETVSVPIFTSFIDTLEVSEESDSSSDISRKTTLSARPYNTPRHRQKWQQQKSLEIAGMPGTNVFEAGDSVAVETEAEEDTDSNLSLDEIENMEESIAAEETIDEREEIAILPETISSSDGNVAAESEMEKVNVENEQDRVLESKLEKTVETETDMKVDIKDPSMKIQDVIPFISSIKELSGVSKDNVENESILVIKEDVECTSTHSDKIKEVFETTKQGSEGEISSLPDQVRQVDSKEDGTRTEDVKIDQTRTRDAEIDKTKRKDGIVRSISERHAAKTDSPESSSKKKQKSKAFSSAEKKDEKSEVKAASMRSRHRSRGYAVDDLDKRKDSGSQKQLQRQEEHQRKQPLPRSKLKKSEIDTSKTRSKYMAWYDKKREEMERKRLEKKASEDEEQMPRWVSRNLKQHRMTEQRDKQSVRRNTLEMTPRTRRKIKPLVNVESEQLKAIVRQGRELRKAEGNLREDPPIQIFARTPPAAAPTDMRHRLLQHSEYKYEKIPAPFYLHPPPAPHPSPQLSPERSFEMQPSTSQREQDESSSTDNVVAFQSGGRLRHQQLLEKKSVFDIAYSEAAPSQLRSDSATPPS